MMLINYHFTKYYLMIMLSFCSNMFFTVTAVERDAAAQEEEKQNIIPNKKEGVLKVPRAKEIMLTIKAMLQNHNVEHHRCISRDSMKIWTENPDWPLPAFIFPGSYSIYCHLCSVGINKDTSIFLASWSPDLTVSNLQEWERVNAIIAVINQSHKTHLLEWERANAIIAEINQSYKTQEIAVRPEMTQAEISSIKGQWRALPLQHSTDARTVTLTRNLFVNWNTITKQEFAKVLWSSFSKLDMQFKTEAKQLLMVFPPSMCKQPFTIHTIRYFLRSNGYIRAEETDILHGKSFTLRLRVHLPSSVSPEYNTLPIEIEATEVLSFKISLFCDKKAPIFLNSVNSDFMQGVVAELNRNLPVRYWNYSHHNGQVQMIISSSYQDMCRNELMKYVSRTCYYVTTEYARLFEMIVSLNRSDNVATLDKIVEQSDHDQLPAYEPASQHIDEHLLSAEKYVDKPEEDSVKIKE